MTRFTERTTAEAVVEAPRQAIWDVLVDPGLVARLTPFVRRITAAGDHWRWELTGLDVLGVKVAAQFTERMRLQHLERIGFTHDPPDGVRERSGVEGWYVLADRSTRDRGEATSLATSLEITLDLPLPTLSSPAVRRAMRGVIGTMGDRFSDNLLDHLGVVRRRN